MSDNEGMTPIVRNTTRLVSGFIVVFGTYIALTGHLGPGGGFAGGVILAAAAALLVLSFGKRVSRSLITEPTCHVADAAGAAGFLALAMVGYVAGGFFVNLPEFVSAGRLHHLDSAGIIPLANLAILVKVGAGLAGAFLALAAFRPGRRTGLDIGAAGDEDGTWEV